MNTIDLTGVIKDIQYSHNVNDIEYYKANLLVKRDNGKEDLINIKFKKFSLPYKENQEISIKGNIRTYSQKLADRNKMEVYVFTYFDLGESDSNNYCKLDGRICSKNPLRKTKDGKDVLDFILANNVSNESQSLNCYIPCVAWGKCAKALNTLNIGDFVSITGQLQSREYKKKISEDDFELRIAHEVSINNFEKSSEHIENTLEN